MSTLSIIVCMARNRVIGRAGGMPWRMPSDLKHFRSVTMGKPVIMGRKTFDSLGKPLPGRPHVVITRDAGQRGRIGGLISAARLPGGVVNSLTDAIALAETFASPEIIVAGGGEIFAQALPLATRVYQTVLAADIEGDTLFPILDPKTWREAARVPLATGPKDDYPADVITYERIRGAG